MKSKIIYSLVLIWTILSGSALSAQTFKGNVADANGPLPGVNVIVKGTSVNTTTDFDGNFTISSMSPNATLVFSYIGYITKEALATSNMAVVLVADSQKLDEVIVTGYVGQKRNSISGAVSQVNMEDLSKTKVPDVTQALQGQVAGVFVAASTGAPGDGIQLRIRGQGTIGNNDALYVVDGIPTRDISFLNSSDVKNITVLKDAASASIYGSRAAGGVVVITTKRGSIGKSSIDVDAFTGIHFALNLPKMLNTDQYLNVKDQAWHNSAGNAANAESPYAFDRRTSTDLADTDWQKELFTTGLSNNIQLSTSGGNDKMQYLVSGGYYGIDGIVTENNDRYKRVNFRTNLNANVTDRFTVGSNVQLSYVKQDRLSSSGDAPGVIRHALIRPPVIGVYKDPSDPTYSANDPYTDLPFYTGPDQNAGGYSRNYEYSSNPLAIVHFTDDTRSTFQLFGNVFAEYAFLKDNSLKFKTNLGADVKYLHNKTFAENYGDANIINPSDQYYGMGRNNRPNSLNENRGEATTFTWSNTLNYVKTFGDHSVNALLGSELIKSKSSAIGGARSNFDNTSEPYRFLDFGGVGSSTTPYPYSSGSLSRYSLLSFFASGTYGYKNRYFVTGTIRADGSSRFSPLEKWGYFPSASANWIVTNENFMSNVSWLSNLKLRASWGINGNQEVPDDAFETFVTTNEFGTEIIRYAGPKFQWESTKQTNFGIDLGLIKNKLSFSVDYFKKETTDMLLQVKLPAVSVGQIQPSYVNTGEVQNDGFEYSLNFQNNDHAFKYGVTANLATLNNEVTKLYNRVKNIDNTSANTRTTVGQPIDAYYGYQFIGIYQNQAEIDSYLYNGANGRLPGDMKFKDVNGDGQIDANDKTFIGNPIPKMTYGLAFNASYKNFDLSFLFQGVEDVDRYNDLKQILDYDTRPFNSTTGVLDSWHGEGTSNTRPRLTFNSNGGQEISSAFVEDASYLRLKNIEIGYTFGKSLVGIANLRIYLSGQNLVTWTDYSGLDPESTNLKDQGTYPQAAAVIFGARIKI
ncbi:SusC/RagA family TonB-linked outer membrane protein [Flavobacterium noncentrifugens]|uniref:TonB-linked outer membrane protein, SusC/RagA family n=1 Tax=Flavobacterium noncentrifugens TaxID=1128970 RepID=A0A1G8ZRM4_9FLAO|nr:TonB-dependent receptor [Flavobacterium noncentrifugens]GEP51889.1 SusC/RagA family TonB-linked outer membrane protein [Flavobacterium noncentrifugens]SDK16800.1 TonB-linked outer membrane protein, SusC/RagA family [Flavobacterium noncentrifugens]